MINTLKVFNCLGIYVPRLTCKNVEPWSPKTLTPFTFSLNPLHISENLFTFARKLIEGTMKRGGDAINARIYNKLRHYYWNAVRSWSTAYTYAKAWVQSVEIGKKCRFYGVPLFILAKGGQIKVGDNCMFRSRKYSNPIGLNHACVFTATPACKGSTARLSIGNNCGMSGVTLRCFKEIKIGNNVRVGANVLIIDGDGHYDDPRTSPPQSIHIEDDVFIGANCVVKKGVTIGKGTVIGMNSVVTKDIPPLSVAVGVPARVVRSLETNE